MHGIVWKQYDWILSMAKNLYLYYRASEPKVNVTICCIFTVLCKDLPVDYARCNKNIDFCAVSLDTLLGVTLVHRASVTVVPRDFG